MQAKNPIICAGQGVLYAEGSVDLVDLSEILEAPVMTTLEGKSAFPENHPLSLGTASGVSPLPVHQFLRRADVVFAVGCSLTRHIKKKDPPILLPHPVSLQRDSAKGVRASRWEEARK